MFVVGDGSLVELLTATAVLGDQALHGIQRITMQAVQELLGLFGFSQTLPLLFVGIQGHLLHAMEQV